MAFDESKIHRVPKGAPGGGEFASARLGAWAKKLSDSIGRTKRVGANFNDPEAQQRWEAKVHAHIQSKGHDSHAIEATVGGFGQDYAEHHSSPKEYADSVTQDARDLGPHSVTDYAKQLGIKLPGHDYAKRISDGIGRRHGEHGHPAGTGPLTHDEKQELHALHTKYMGTSDMSDAETLRYHHLLQRRHSNPDLPS